MKMEGNLKILGFRNLILLLFCYYFVIFGHFRFCIGLIFKVRALNTDFCPCFIAC